MLLIVFYLMRPVPQDVALFRKLQSSLNIPVEIRKIRDYAKAPVDLGTKCTVL